MALLSIGAWHWLDETSPGTVSEWDTIIACRSLFSSRDDRVLLERVEVPGADRVVEASRLQDKGREEELVRQLLAPLPAKISRHDHQQAALAFGPALGEQ